MISGAHPANLHSPERFKNPNPVSGKKFMNGNMWVTDEELLLMMRLILMEAACF